MAYKEINEIYAEDAKKPEDGDYSLLFALEECLVEEEGKELQ